MSRRAINAARAEANPEWRNPAHGTGIALVAKTDDEKAAEERLSKADEVAQLRAENARLTRENAELRRSAPPRAPTQAEILAAIQGAIATKTTVEAMPAPLVTTIAEKLAEKAIKGPATKKSVAKRRAARKGR